VAPCASSTAHSALPLSVLSARSSCSYASGSYVMVVIIRSNSQRARSNWSVLRVQTYETSLLRATLASFFDFCRAKKIFCCTIILWFVRFGGKFCCFLVGSGAVFVLNVLNKFTCQFADLSIATLWSKILQPCCFRNNFVYCQWIFIIFGRQML